MERAHDVHAANAEHGAGRVLLPPRRVRGRVHSVHPDHRAGRGGRCGRDGAVGLVARPAALRAGGRAGDRPLRDRRAVRALPDRRLRGMGAPRCREPSTSRCSMSRSRTGSASRRRSASTRRRADRRSRSSTPATSIRATTSSSRPTSWGTFSESHMIELIGSEQQRQFGLDKRETLPQFCLECEVRFACHGGCPKDRFIETPDGEAGLNYLCDGYKAFFHHIDRPMQLMSRAASATAAHRPTSCGSTRRRMRAVDATTRAPAAQGVNGSPATDRQAPPSCDRGDASPRGSAVGSNRASPRTPPKSRESQ